MPYRHDFNIRFQATSEDPAGLDLSGERMLEALEARLAEFRANPQLLRDLAGAPLSSTEQPLWVLRTEDEPLSVRNRRGAWVPAGEVVPADAVSGETAARTPAIRPGAFWCHLDFLLGTPVLADLHSDDHIVDTELDIRPWLASAEPSEILELAGDGWSFAESADRVFYALEAMGCPEALRLSNYLALNPVMGFTGDTVGFGLSAPECDALDWLEEHRPDVRALLAAPEDAPAP
ncbi:hypothetical protein LAZ40_09705 [Cereibacter sphaeroides]|uniref:hypothetical protein n=1 Tax=Cereibacter sphaeroides TaxID=1063 RepID=UPI001F37E410|nr:hypothetical protein [Cereibacter sphaeroides]MCE6959325.1 hypothetical protein [Cereibacter sphaeroides]MCE6972917.1 hypothetical protein [Cereibacter sphaeroides]